MSYYDLPGAPPEEYATAGIGYIPYPQHVDPGIDISHYGAPYKQMLGLDGLGEVGEMLYRYQGLGWAPGPGQRWADDPRMVKKFAEITVTYKPSNIPSSQASKAADMILARARSAFSGMTVRKIGTTGWTRDGRVGFTVILRRETRAGVVREKSFQVGQYVGPRIGTNTRLVDTRVSIPERFYTATAPAPVTSDSPDDMMIAAEVEEPFLTRKVAGLPVWAIGLIGVGILGGGAFMLTRKKPVAANRRRRRRRRRRR